MGYLINSMKKSYVLLNYGHIKVSAILIDEMIEKSYTIISLNSKSGDYNTKSGNHSQTFNVHSLNISSKNDVPFGWP
jgi:hypothetical protein